MLDTLIQHTPTTTTKHCISTIIYTLNPSIIYNYSSQQLYHSTTQQVKTQPSNSTLSTSATPLLNQATHKNSTQQLNPTTNHNYSSQQHPLGYWNFVVARVGGCASQINMKTRGYYVKPCRIRPYDSTLRARCLAKLASRNLAVLANKSAALK